MPSAARCQFLEPVTPPDDGSGTEQVPKPRLRAPSLLDDESAVVAISLGCRVCCFRLTSPSRPSLGLCAYATTVTSTDSLSSRSCEGCRTVQNTFSSSTAASRAHGKRKVWSLSLHSVSFVKSRWTPLHRGPRFAKPCAALQLRLVQALTHHSPQL